MTHATAGTRGQGRPHVKPRITSGFVFKSVFADAPERCKTLVEVSLSTRIKSVEFVQPERELDVLQDKRAGSIDLLVVDADGNRYDVEIQARRRKDEILRTRRYQALMDVTQLRSGVPVNNLRDSVVIFICDFDPLGDGLRRYDCRTTCLETGTVIPDGRRIVFLNAKGEHGEVPRELEAFLRLVAGEEVHGDPFVDDINDTIDAYITRPDWLEEYMNFEDELETEREYAKQEGYVEGYDEGKAAAQKEMVTKLVRSGALSAEDAAHALGLTADEVREILEGR